MNLLLTYLVLSTAGSFAIYLIGLGVERVVPAASLPAFLVLFFLMLWVTWIVSVRLTAPKDQPTA